MMETNEVVTPAIGSLKSHSTSLGFRHIFASFAFFLLVLQATTVLMAHEMPYSFKCDGESKVLSLNTLDEDFLLAFWGDSSCSFRDYKFTLNPEQLTVLAITKDTQVVRDIGVHNLPGPIGYKMLAEAISVEEVIIRLKNVENDSIVNRLWRAGSNGNELLAIIESDLTYDGTNLLYERIISCEGMILWYGNLWNSDPRIVGSISFQVGEEIEHELVDQLDVFSMSIYEGESIVQIHHSRLTDTALGHLFSPNCEIGILVHTISDQVNSTGELVPTGSLNLFRVDSAEILVEYYDIKEMSTRTFYDNAFIREEGDGYLVAYSVQKSTYSNSSPLYEWFFSIEYLNPDSSSCAPILLERYVEVGMGMDGDSIRWRTKNVTFIEEQGFPIVVVNYSAMKPVASMNNVVESKCINSNWQHKLLFQYDPTVNPLGPYFYLSEKMILENRDVDVGEESYTMIYQLDWQLPD